MRLKMHAQQMRAANFATKKLLMRMVLIVQLCHGVTEAFKVLYNRR